MKAITYRILTLIGIIILLLGSLIITGIIDIKPPGQETENRTRILQLVASIESYTSTYKMFPIPESDRIIDNPFPTPDSYKNEVTIDESQYKKLIVSLQGENVRNQIFLKTWNHKFTDTWGNNFNIILDTNFDSKISFNKETIKSTVLVYSNGLNQKNDNAQKDDICSWK